MACHFCWLLAKKRLTATDWQLSVCCPVVRGIEVNQRSGRMFLSGKFSQILQHNLWNFTKFCCTVTGVLVTIRTSPYFTWWQKSPTVPSISVSCSSCHACHKSKLTTRFYWFINGKIKKEPKKPLISKNGQLRVLLQQGANSMTTGEFLDVAWKSTCCWILLSQLISWCSCMW